MKISDIYIIYSDFDFTNKKDCKKRKNKNNCKINVFHINKNTQNMKHLNKNRKILYCIEKNIYNNLLHYCLEFCYFKILK